MKNKLNDGGPAFPATCTAAGIPIAVYHPPSQVSGMSLRDWFAGQAFASLRIDCFGAKGAAENAYEIADAMLAERESKTT